MKGKLRYILTLLLSCLMAVGVVFANQVKTIENGLINENDSSYEVGLINEQTDAKQSIEALRAEAVEMASASSELKTDMQKVAKTVLTKSEIRGNTVKVTRNSKVRPNFMTMNLQSKSGFTKSEIEKMLKGTRLEGLGESVLIAEHLYDVNGLFIVSLAQHESGNGNSRIAREKNNLFGIGAYDSSPYKSAKTYASKDECIMEFARMIKKSYFDKRGRKTVQKIGQIYASDPNWSITVSKKMSNNWNKVMK